jgi:hypothetical protein
MRPCILALLCVPILAVPAQAQWDLQDSHTTASLRGIHNVGGGVAWASGTDGTVLRTEDGGYLWQTCTIPPGAEKLDFRGIQAFDENTAIVMSSGKGDLSRLYETTDGCKTWKLVFTNPDKDGFWDALQISFKGHGYPQPINGVLIGDPVGGKFPIFVTSDSGNTWNRWGRSGSGWKGPCGERDAHAQKEEALFAASNESLLFGSGPTAFLFVTGGASGSRVFSSNYSEWDGPPCSTNFLTDRLEIRHTNSSSGSFAAAASGWDQWLPEKLMVVGGDYTRPNDPGFAFFLTQKSASFHLPFTSYFASPQTAQTPPHGYRSSVAYDPSTKTWITVGPNGTDISTDDGKNWRTLHPKPGQAADADKNWNALSLPFVVGLKGRIGKLRDDALKP